MVATLRREMRVLCGHLDPCKDDRAYSRAAYSIEMPRPLFDWLFNSKNGYRAWYFRSGYDGLRNNARLIRAITPALVDTATVDGSFARDSLDALTAKAWLAERGNEVCRECAGCDGEWSPPQDDTPEIRNGRWELSTDPRSKCGRKAPYLAKLRIFGGFLNSNSDEWVAERKRHRSRDIEEHGWS
jgi:hypothetical protein